MNRHFVDPDPFSFKLGKKTDNFPKETPKELEPLTSPDENTDSDNGNLPWFVDYI